MPQRIRFSLRALLLLTGGVALAISLFFAWPSSGALIGPSLFLLFFLCSTALLFARKNAGCKRMLRLSVASLAFIVLLYASFGPASWAMARFNTPGSKIPWAYEAYSYVYRPIATNLIFSPAPIRSASIRYTAWWMPDGAEFHDWGIGLGWSVPGWTYTVIHY